LRTDCVSHRTFFSRITAGSRQPLQMHNGYTLQCALLQRKRAHPPRAAGVSPPWVADCVCDGNEVSLPVSSSHAEGIARGAYAPRSWCMERRSSAGRTTPFAMQKRTFAGAAGVSPPWVANRVCDGNEVSLPVSSSHAEGIARGAYAPPLLVHGTAFVCRKNNVFCDAETHIRKSGGRKPAVG
jgi:hypothetical protein